MKKYLALILAVLMLATVFAGCASTTEETDTPAASTETTEPAKTEDSKPEATKTEEPAEGPAAKKARFSTSMPGTKSSRASLRNITPFPRA